MAVKIIKEDGVLEALFGIGLNKRLTSHIEAPEKMSQQLVDNLYNISVQLFNKEGHNKFLESIVVWLDIRMPLYWWKQFDTYQAGIATQSESTIFTLMEREVSLADFKQVGDTKDLYGVVMTLNSLRKKKDFDSVNRLLPQSYLQRRFVVTNYKQLRDMYQQRKNHKLEEWIEFCAEISKLQYNNYVIE